MTLAEFMKKRREELGLSWNDIIDGGIANNTWCNVVNGKQLTVKPATMEKLARLLECTIGELQAHLAETPNPLRKEAEKPEGQAGISITVRPKKKPKPEAPAPDPEEPAEVFDTDEPEPEPDVDMMFPAEPEAEEEEQAEYTLSEVKTFEQMALNDYKQHLRELAWRIFASGVPGVHTMEKIYADIGYALVQELGIKNKGGEEE